MPGQFNRLQDIQCEFLESLLPPAPFKRGKGKLHTPWRKICNILFWMLITGSRSAIHRWQENGTFILLNFMVPPLIFEKSLLLFLK